MENLHKVGGSLKRLRQAETLLWQGQVDAAKALLLIAPLNKLRILSTTSTSTVTASSTTSTTRQNRFVRLALGRSAVKQIDRRTKISGAQWNKDVPQVLAHRCAYLNGLLTV